MHISIYFTMVIISFLASLTAYFQKGAMHYLRLFPIFLISTFIVEAFATWQHDHGGSTSTLYNIFSTVEFLFYMYALREIIQSIKVKKIILFIALLYLFLSVANVLFIQKIISFNSMTYAIGCLIIAVLCFYYFFELFQLAYSTSLTGQPAFWICSGLFFYYICSFPIYGLVNFLKYAPAIIKNNIEVIILLLNVFLYSSFTIAFLCRIRARNSTS